MSLRIDHARGMTLIELMIALALFALLGLLTWRATDSLITTRQHVGAELERWRAITTAVARVDEELLQALPGTGRLAHGPPPSRQPEAVGTGPAQVMLRFASPGADGGPVQDAALLLVGDRLEWWIWDGTDAAAEPSRVRLLDRVNALHWRFLHGDRWVAAWPPEQPQDAGLPAAIAFEMELSDVGTIRRVFALR